MKRLILIGLMASCSALAADQQAPVPDAPTCFMWGGSSSASQGQFIKCPVDPVVITKTETKVEKVPVPFPVIKEVEKKKIKE